MVYGRRILDVDQMDNRGIIYQFSWSWCRSRS